ncbi:MULTISPECIES: hypothetical protein [unclassified Pseudomonas]|uniref:hypothetical protein n=1 Tax=unclassified Pseudomonas TaxID=196821 RepID=UPI002AC8BD45|nr:MULTISPECIES: hypothetical protein [unclassified Pseudomonas]MEB0043790.1 hypothetical protein [Pseudomonas sp. Dout3]MEB0095272.1 hypothetical protein [Pseudomonas sp. DC1.2]WPX58828.1 hypothetical protein RHM68_25170 [Pseudomonas sp. DC1.2]
MKQTYVVPISITVVLGMALIYWMYLKTEAAALAGVYSTTWNESRTCYINSYIPQYAALGVPGKLVRLFASEAFFRVYNKEDKLLKSSEWLFWQKEFTTDERSQWVNSRAIYPTANGYEGWIIPACN